MKKEEHLEIYGGLREKVGMKTYLHCPMDYSYAKTLILRFRAGDLDLPERRRNRYGRGRGEEEEDAQMYPGGKAVE